MGLHVGSRKIELGSEPFFIADIAANHDGELARAIDLIHLAAQSGAHAAKFQHFSAETLVSDEGFRALGGKLSHQSGWSKSVYEVYKDASIDLGWTDELARACAEAGIAFMSTPYSIELAQHIDPYVEAYKVGSGDITNIDLIAHVAGTQKPWLIATGAADMTDVRRAVNATGDNASGVLMQCNTNYTAGEENFDHINLNVLKTFGKEFPNLVLGLSDHTLGHSTVVAALALGARVFEKHFTDDNNRDGPDHFFSMNPSTWRAMVDAAGECYRALGGETKQVEQNELETVVLQRRSLRAREDLAPGTVMSDTNLVALRPAPSGSIPPFELNEVKGMVTKEFLPKGSVIQWENLVTPS